MLCKPVIRVRGSERDYVIPACVEGGLWKARVSRRDRLTVENLNSRKRPKSQLQCAVCQWPPWHCLSVTAMEHRVFTNTAFHHIWHRSHFWLKVHIGLLLACRPFCAVVRFRVTAVLHHDHPCTRPSVPTVQMPHEKHTNWRPIKFRRATKSNIELVRVTKTRFKRHLNIFIDSRYPALPPELMTNRRRRS